MQALTWILNWVFKGIFIYAFFWIVKITLMYYKFMFILAFPYAADLVGGAPVEKELDWVHDIESRENLKEPNYFKTPAERAALDRKRK